MKVLLSLMAAVFIFAQGQKPDSDYVSLSRGGCYGTCPVYTVTIFSNGTVNYLGERFVHVTGKREYKIPVDSVNYLFRKAEEIGFFSLKDEYRVAKFVRKNQFGKLDTLEEIVTDLPTYVVKIKRGNQTKSVVDYFRVFLNEDKEKKKFEAPKSLKDFENEIDRIGMTERFTDK